MIADVDASLITWLARSLPDVSIVLAPPAADPGTAPDKTAAPDKAAAGRSGSADVTLMLYLGQIREELDSAEPGWSAVRNEQGVVTGRQAPTRSYRLSYLLVPFSADPLAEHLVLGQILASSALDTVLPDEVLRGSLIEVEHPIMVRAAPPNASLDTRELWAAWGLRPRATLELSVLAPMPPSAVSEVAAAPAHIEMGTSRLPSILPPKPQSEQAVPRPSHRINE